MVYATYCDDITRKKRWAEQHYKITLAIASFPLLKNELNLGKYDDSAYDDETAILALFLNNNRETLRKIEGILSTDSILPSDLEERKNVIDRLNNVTSPSDILSVITELDIFSRIIEKIGSVNVKHNPPLPNGRYSDIRAKVNGKEIYLEIKNLGMSEAEKKIKQIMYAGSVYQVESVKSPCCLISHMDTAKLPLEVTANQEGKLDKIIDETSSIEKLKSEIDALRFDLLPNQLYTLRIKEDILDCLLARKYGFSKELFKEESAETSLWVNSLKLDSIEKIELINSFMRFDSEGKCAQFQDLGQFPSSAFNFEIESFMNRFINGLKDKIFIKKQFHPDFPNIIVVQWSHWIEVLKGYYENILSLLIARIKKEIFATFGSECISGVAIFTAICPIAFDKSIYITNENAKISSKLDQHDIVDVGFYGIQYAP